MKPLMYGYMRVPSGIQDDILRGLEGQLRRFAEEKGYQFVTIFFEMTPGSLAAWDELADALRRSEARHVVVPTLNHIARHPVLCGNLLRQIEEDVQGEVLTLRD